jgi:hypothetical protein
MATPPTTKEREDRFNTRRRQRDAQRQAGDEEAGEEGGRGVTRRGGKNKAKVANLRFPADSTPRRARRLARSAKGGYREVCSGLALGALKSIVLSPLEGEIKTCLRAHAFCVSNSGTGSSRTGLVYGQPRPYQVFCPYRRHPVAVTRRELTKAVMPTSLSVQLSATIKHVGLIHGYPGSIFLRTPFIGLEVGGGGVYRAQDLILDFLISPDSQCKIFSGPGRWGGGGGQTG